MKKNIAIIPARGGSKRLPGKNSKSFFGKPIIQYSIEAAKQTGLFEKIIVSTDSDEIKEVALKSGAEVPFLRPPHLADDFTPLADVIHHALTWLLEERNESYDAACCLLATAPFIQKKYILEGFEILKSEKVSAVVPVTSFAYPIFRSLKISEQGHLKMFWPEYELTRSNDLPEALHDVGQFYWLDVLPFMKNKRLVPPDSLPVHIPRYLVQDIDTEEDWKVAEVIFRSLNL